MGGGPPVLIGPKRSCKRVLSFAYRGFKKQGVVIGELVADLGVTGD